MADQNGGTAMPGGQPAGAPQIIVNAQYVKDLSFENPRAPHSLMQQKEPPEVQVGIELKAQPLAQDVFEVVLTVSVNGTSAGEAVYVVELSYAAVVTVRNTPQELMAAALLVETPRLLFPFARSIIASAIREGGFPPLMLHPVDFAELLRRQQPSPMTAPVATA
jgi:preprotein translocase subunit SecB